jgi:hypothetical protein
MVFQPNAEPLGLAVQATVQAALHQWLGDVIQVERVEVLTQESSLHVTVAYVLRSTQESRIEQFRSSV